MAGDAPDPPEKPESKDVVLLGGPTADGEGVQVLRARNDCLETGELRTLKEGRPVTGEIVTLKPREGTPRICDVETTYAPARTDARTEGRGEGATAKPPAAPVAHKGPARVSSDAYRAGWDEVFGPTDRSKLN